MKTTINSKNAKETAARINAWIDQDCIVVNWGKDSCRNETLMQAAQAKIPDLVYPDDPKIALQIRICGKYNKSRCVAIYAGDSITFGEELVLETKDDDIVLINGAPAMKHTPMRYTIRRVQVSDKEKREQQFRFLVDEAYELESAERESRDFRREFMSFAQKEANLLAEKELADAYSPFLEFLYNTYEQAVDMLPPVITFQWSVDDANGNTARVSAFLNLEEKSLAFTDEAHDISYDDFFVLMNALNGEFADETKEEKEEREAREELQAFNWCD